ncbi:Protease inhibitor epi5 [Globisporangium polare]
MAKLLLKSVLALVALVQLSSVSSTQAVKSCERDCETNVSPICASDGVTYANACLFDQAHCLNSNLLPMHYGACSS